MHTVTRGKAEPASRGSTAPPPELIMPPSNRALTCRRKCLANEKLDWVHSVTGGPLVFRGVNVFSINVLCHNRQPSACPLGEISGLVRLASSHRPSETRGAALSRNFQSLGNCTTMATPAGLG